MAGKLPDSATTSLGIAVRSLSSRSRKRCASIRSRSADEPAWAGEIGFGCLDVGQHRLADDGAEQVLLGWEIEVDRALADAGGSRDVLQLGRGVATLGERGEGGGDDFAGSGFLAAGASGMAVTY